MQGIKKLKSLVGQECCPECMEKSCRSVRPKIQTGVLLKLFLKTEGIFSTDNFQRKRTYLFLANLALLIAGLLAVVIVGQCQTGTLLNVFLTIDTDQRVKYK